MHSRVSRRWTIVAGLLLAGQVAAVSPASPADTTRTISVPGDAVLIYRCEDARHHVALQDHPCPGDAQQKVLQMIRPVDAPPRPQPIASAAPPPPAEVRIVREYTPEPMYECTNAETGETYTSSSGVGQRRYVTWAAGFGDFVPIGPRPPLSQPVLVNPPLSPTPKPHPIEHPRHGRFVFPSTSYVEDSCVRLSRGETCERLRQRDDELGKLIFNGQANDRIRYDREQKGLRAQLRDDCGGY